MNKFIGETAFHDESCVVLSSYRNPAKLCCDAQVRGIRGEQPLRRVAAAAAAGRDLFDFDEEPELMFGKSTDGREYNVVVSLSAMVLCARCRF